MNGTTIIERSLALTVYVGSIEMIEALVHCNSYKLDFFEKSDSSIFTEHVSC